jgi:hypothetical protein
MQIANINGFDQILCDHDDGMIAKTIVYIGEPSINPDNDMVSYAYAYVDADRTTKYTTAQLVEACVKGCVILPIGATELGADFMLPSIVADGIIIVNTFFDGMMAIIPAEINIDDMING